ncbi:MAG: hypothetical protein JSW28_09955 [Thermoplasmata archaeon]|nr:MAG: hypothetical protein JSW28_09955 [Thermoplasmata archaeon]
MVAIDKSMLDKIRLFQDEVEPHIVDMIKCSDESNCPYKVMRGGDTESWEMRDAVTKIARMLYKTGLLTKMNLSLSDDGAIDTLLYAFGYWGGQTLHKYGDDICHCNDRCY